MPHNGNVNACSVRSSRQSCQCVAASKAGSKLAAVREKSPCEDALHSENAGRIIENEVSKAGMLAPSDELETGLITSYNKVAPSRPAWRLQLRAHRGLQRELFAKQACVVSLLAPPHQAGGAMIVDPKMFYLDHPIPSRPRTVLRCKGLTLCVTVG